MMLSCARITAFRFQPLCSQAPTHWESGLRQHLYIYMVRVRVRVRARVRGRVRGRGRVRVRARVRVSGRVASGSIWLVSK